MQTPTILTLVLLALAALVWAGAAAAFVALRRVRALRDEARRAAEALERERIEAERLAEEEASWSVPIVDLVAPAARLAGWTLGKFFFRGKKRKKAMEPETEVRMERKGLGMSFFLLGCAIGAACGVLLAPEKGDKTRKKVSDWLDKEKEVGLDLLERGQDRLVETKEHVVEAMKAGKEAMTRNGHKKTTVKA